MPWKQTSKYVVFGALGFLLVLLSPVAAHAAQSSSANYQVNEVFFGAGGELDGQSAHYQAKEAIGETAVGDTSSAGYQAHAGFNTDRLPYLQFLVNATNTDVGGLSTGYATDTTATFSVKNYLSSGYSVVTISNPPQYNSYTMQAPSTATPSSPGTEQFGMNLAQNSCTTSHANCSGTFGTAPNQVPSGTFSYGQVDSAYSTANEYAYVPGSRIAFSNSSSGETDYTISYLYNISNLTPGGTYTFNDVLVATATF